MRSLVAALLSVCGVAAFLNPEEVSTAHFHNATLESAEPAVHSLSKRSAFFGTATWYDVETWVAGACGQDIDNDMHIVALNQPMYGDLDSRSSWCGRHIMIANGLKTARAVIMDACPETRQCHYGSLDMSMSLFEEFHDLTLGVFPIAWWTIDGDDQDGGDSSHGSGDSNSGESSSDGGSDKNGNNGGNDNDGNNSSGNGNNNGGQHPRPHSSPSSSPAPSPSKSPSNPSPSNSPSTNQRNNDQAARESKARAASVSSASAVSKAASIASAQSAARASASSKKAASMASVSSARSSSSSVASASQSAVNAGLAPPGQVGTGGESSQTDPREGNLQNFVKVLNGLSMLVHAAAQG